MNNDGNISSFINKKINEVLNNKIKEVNIDDVEFPPELEHLYYDLGYEKLSPLKDRQFGEELLEFSKVIIENFDEENLVNFYNNIADIKTAKLDYDEINKLIKKTSTVIKGSYIVNDNLMVLGLDDYKNTIYHELFHLSSSCVKDDVTYSGFTQSTPKMLIGDGINEGYTQLLTERYFGDKDIIRAYQYFVQIAGLLENIVDKDKMEVLYLNSNLYGLIDELKQYAYYKDIMKFFVNTDFLFRHLNDTKISNSKYRILNESLKEVSDFLILAYSNKINKKYSFDYKNNGEIVLEDMNSFLRKVPAKMKTNNKIYDFGKLTNEMFEKIKNILYEYYDESEEEIVYKKSL